MHVPELTYLFDVAGNFGAGALDFSISGTEGFGCGMRLVRLIINDSDKGEAQQRKESYYD
jgi:hypothetical protein